MQKFIDAAYTKIEHLYAQEKSRKFILHLIASFLPIIEHNFYLSGKGHKCSITDKIGIDLEDYTDFSIAVMKSQLDDNKEKTKSLYEAYKIKLNIEDGEVLLETRRMYYSDKSDKVLSMPALIALNQFAALHLITDRNINRLITQSRFEKIPNVSKKEAKIAAHKSVGHTLSDGNEAIFEQLKQKFAK